MVKQLKSSVVAPVFSYSLYFLFFPASTNFTFIFVRFSKLHAFDKPNDERALRLMNACATSMLNKVRDIVFAYGVSDEYRYNYIF